jgi:type III pantothenate kinase
MLLVIDVGNSNIVAAVFYKDKLVNKWRLVTHGHQSSDEYGSAIINIMQLDGVNPQKISNIIVASVVPKMNQIIADASEKYFKLSPLFLSDNMNKLGIKVLIDNPAEVGEDRLVNSIAAFEEYRKAAIVIDFGTATTFDVINDKGDYLGGVIAPGINLSMDALSKATAKLPSFAIAKPSSAIGKDTMSAMQSGVFYGYLGLIEKIVSNIKCEYGKEMIVLATGGLAAMFADDSDVIELYNPDLTINGLKIIFDRVKSSH